MEITDSYYDRDLSWLSFNRRVLMEADENSLPPYERLKFLAIYSSNLDEFFRVRVAAIRSVMTIKKSKRREWGLRPKQLMNKIQDIVGLHQEEIGRILNMEILPELAANNIVLLQGAPEHPEHKAFVRQYFANEVQPFVHPVLLKKGKIRYFLRDRQPYLAVKLRDVSRADMEDAEYAEVLIPSHYFKRFVMLPQTDERHTIMFLDDIVRFNLDVIFPGYQVICSHSIKMNRNADLQIEDEFRGELLDKIKKSLTKRLVGLPSRFLYDRMMPADMLEYLRETYGFTDEDLIPGGPYHNFSDFFSFPNPRTPLFERKLPLPLPNPDLDRHPYLYDSLREKSYLLHFPYQSFDYVLRFLNTASFDREVTEIKTTQYRVASNSAIVAALIRAARQGKKVTVFVEIKARFDEESNLRSAREMEEAGVRIIYSLPGLKVHAKVLLVIRKNDAGKDTSLAFLSTGNFNEKTARLYCDHGYFTCNPDTIRELNHVFAYLDNQSYQPPPFRHIMVAQFNLRKGFEAMIDREIKHARSGKKAYIAIKLNNLEDIRMIDKLYEASQAGVKIDLIVRSICVLRPGVAGLSENITVTRLVDQYLEHGRIFVFYNLGAWDTWLSSADWMQRNLDRRVEVAFPVQEAALKTELLHVLLIQLMDNIKAVRLNADIENIPIDAHGKHPVRAQVDLYHLIQDGHLGMLPPSMASVQDPYLLFSSLQQAPAQTAQTPARTTARKSTKKIQT